MGNIGSTKYSSVSTNEANLYGIDDVNFTLSLKNFWKDRFPDILSAKKFVSQNMLINIDYSIQDDDFYFTPSSIMIYWKLSKK